MVCNSLKGKVALVTGASRGIGKGIARAMAEAGADVVVTARAEKLLGEVQHELCALGSNASYVKADITNISEVQDMLQEVIRTYGKIDILVNSAGTNIGNKVLEVSEEEWDTIMEVNLKGVFFCCKEAARYMLKQGGGKIINITSNASVEGFPGISVYCASKGGLTQLTKAMALEWAPFINVNAVGPGYIRTEMTAHYFANKEKSKKIFSRTPQQRVGEPADVAGVAVFLASSAADYITGESIYVDGGWLAGRPES